MLGEDIEYPDVIFFIFYIDVFISCNIQLLKSEGMFRVVDFANEIFDVIKYSFNK